MPYPSWEPPPPPKYLNRAKNTKKVETLLYIGGTRSTIWVNMLVKWTSMPVGGRGQTKWHDWIEH